jgi:hypothetical protein
MKKTFILVSLIINGYSSFSQISKFPTSKDYVLFEDCIIPRKTTGKFLITPSDSCQQLYYGDNVVYSTYYANVQWNNKEDIEKWVNDLMGIIKYYKTKFGLGNEVSFFKPTTANGQCYHDLFDEEYFKKNKRLDYDKMYKTMSTCMFSLEATYTLIPGQLEIDIVWDMLHIGYIIKII